MDKLTAIKIKYDDGTYSDEIPVSVLSENVEWDNTHTLVDVLGSIDVDVTGTIQDQISQLFNEKISATQLQNYVASQLNEDVSTWLNNNVDPVGSAVIVDSSLTISGAAADAKKTGDEISDLKHDVDSINHNIDISINDINNAVFTAHKSVNLIFQQAYTEDYHMTVSDGAIIENLGTYSLIVPVLPGKTLSIRRTADSYRGIGWTFSEYPIIGSKSIRQIVNNSSANSNVTITLQSNEKYILYYYGTDSSASSYPIQASRDSSMIYYGSSWSASDTVKFATPAQVENVEQGLKDRIAYYDLGNIKGNVIEGKYVSPSTGAFNTDADKSRTDFIICEGFRSLTVITTHASTYNAFYDSTKTFIPDSEFETTLGKNQIAVPSTAKYVVFSDRTSDMQNLIVKSNVYHAIDELDMYDTQKEIMRLKQAIELTDDLENIFNTSAQDVNLVVNTSTLEISSSQYTVSTYIPIDPYKIVSVERTVTSTRFSACTCTKIPAEGDYVSVANFNNSSNNIDKFTFVTKPKDRYLLITYYKTNDTQDNTQEQVKAGLRVYYGTATKSDEYTERLSTPNLSSMLMLNNQMVNLLCKRQLGPLKQGYVCLSSDDGDEQLALYVLPKLHQFANAYGKQIPLTMGLAGYTNPPFPVLNNQTYIAVVVNAIENYNCSIGIHGNIMFTNYTREKFYDYLTNQDANIYDITGHHPSSVLYVSHGVSNDVMLIAGSFYGVCGSIPTATGSGVESWGNNARSNMYAMKRFSLFNVDISDQDIKDAVDYALDNNEILCPYWHDYIFGGDYEGVVSGQAAKDRLDMFINYCIGKNVDFINFGDIPMLEVNV